VKLLRDTKTLKGKALSSLRRGLAAFNSFDDDGRVTAVLLHLQHACEMLLKAALVQQRVSIFDKKSGTSEGIKRCVGLAQAKCGLTDDEAGTIRAINSLRDAEQHWLLVVEEGLLYVHARALVTVFDEVLKRDFDDALVNHLPLRVLPVSSANPANIDLLMDQEYQRIVELLAPGRRARDEARGRIRALLAMEAHAVEEVEVSERDINRIERAIKGGKEFSDVFPRLSNLAASVEGEGINLKVHFTKRQGAPVHFVNADDPAQAAAVREVDLRRKYHMSPTQLAKKLALTPPKAAALRWKAGIDDDPNCRHVFVFGKSKFPSFSDNAFNQMKAAMEQDSIDDIWAEFRAQHVAG
jgi:hypothetical protein